MVVKKPATPAVAEYDADALITLDPMAYIQKRPSLSLGPHERMQLVALREPIDNSIDEYRAGHGKTVSVTIFPDGAAQIEDSGRGVPTGINKQTGENGIYMAFGKVGSGGKFGAADSGYSGAASLGTNGVGTSATSATSTRFDTLVFKAGKITRLSFKNGKPGHFADDSGPDAVFTPSMDVKVSPDNRSAAEKKARPSGTTIKFWPNAAIFGHDSSFRVDELREVLRSSAFLIPGLRIVIDDRTVGAEQVDEYEFDGGFVDMIDAFATDVALHAPIHLETSGHFKETIPMPQKDGSVRPEEVERHVKIDTVLRWGEGYDTNIRSYVNTIYTSLGGVHVQGLERALSKVVVDYIKNNSRGLLKAKEELPILADIEEGLTAIVSIEQNEAKFTSQDKTKLSGAETGKVVSAALIEALKEWFDNKKHATTAKLIATRVVDASRVRLAARASKDVARKQSALESASSMPAKLVACSSKDSSLTELQICEGDSALGGLKLSRSSTFQAIYPLKGKPLNVFNATLSKVLENQEWADLIQIIGAGVGRTFDLEAMRYKRIILLADADPDGNHIAVLLTSFFWKYMRPLVEDGRLYIALPPLFSITTTGKNKERFYALNKDELDKLVKRLATQGKKYEKIQRHKGLGEYSPDILAEVVMKPESRILRQVTAENIAEVERVLELTMGANASNRRDWIIENRGLITEDELDIA